MIARAKLLAAARVAGIEVKALDADGDDEGKAVLADGTIVHPDGRLSHEDPGAVPDALAAAAYRSLLAAHDPSPSPEEAEAARLERGGGVLGALALVLRDGAAAPAWAQAVLDTLASRARSAV